MLINKNYCDYETCVALRELGFNYPQRLIPDYFGVFEEPQYDENIHLYDAQKWLREVKDIIVEVFVDDYSDTPITYNIYKDRECVCHHHGKYWSVKDWSEALSEGIKAAVKILKNNGKAN